MYFGKSSDIYRFGHYEQDGRDNGAEEIEWIVLTADDEGVLLLSRYILDRVPYNAGSTAVTWEICTLRQWLNSTFYDDAFSEEEQVGILKVSLENEGNPVFGTSGCGQTQDKVFVLSISEALANLDRVYLSTQATAYARKQGAVLHKGRADKNVYWWLRTPGKNAESAMVTWVSKNDYDYEGNGVGERFATGGVNNTGVRPALWLSRAYVSAHEQ